MMPCLWLVAKERGFGILFMLRLGSTNDEEMILGSSKDVYVMRCRQDIESKNLLPLFFMRVGW